MVSIFALVSADAPPYQVWLATALKNPELFGSEAALEVNGSKLGFVPRRNASNFRPTSSSGAPRGLQLRLTSFVRVLLQTRFDLERRLDRGGITRPTQQL